MLWVAKKLGIDVIFLADGKKVMVWSSNILTVVKNGMRAAIFCREWEKSIKLDIKRCEKCNSNVTVAESESLTINSWGFAQHCLHWNLIKH
jgi:hypothetical protein